MAKLPNFVGVKGGPANLFFVPGRFRKQFEGFGGRILRQAEAADGLYEAITRLPPRPTFKVAEVIEPEVKASGVRKGTRRSSTRATGRDSR